MGHPSCAGCPDCNTTLEEGPELHRTPSPHDWREEYELVDKQTGATRKIRLCLRCLKKEEVRPTFCTYCHHATFLHEQRGDRFLCGCGMVCTAEQVAAAT